MGDFSKIYQLAAYLSNTFFHLKAQISYRFKSSHLNIDSFCEYFRLLTNFSKDVQTMNLVKCYLFREKFVRNFTIPSAVQI